MKPGVNPSRGTAVRLDAPNVDTDQIMPKQFCLRTDRTGYADAVFYEWRKAGHPALDHARAKSSPLLVAGPNFGCGSSREHAVWGLLDFGFKTVIAPSFGDTFRANAGAAGLVTAQIDPADCARLLAVLDWTPDAQLALDVASGALRVADLALVTAIPAFHRHLYLGGFTEVELAAHHDEKIRAHEARRPAWMPRVGPA